MMSFSTLVVTTDDLSAIGEALATKFAAIDALFPVILDASVPIDLAKLLVVVRDARLQPIGVAEGLLAEQASLFKLAILPKSGGGKVQGVLLDSDSNQSQASITSQPSTQQQASAQQKDVPQTQATQADVSGKSAQAHKGHTVVQETVLRSGQSVSNLEGDLVVTGGVNNGSEAIATGSLHVYGKAQGRLVAGAMGDESAYIFCQQLEPTLVSIAGVYCLPESIPQELVGQAAYVKYDKDVGLVFTGMNPAIQ